MRNIFNRSGEHWREPLPESLLQAYVDNLLPSDGRAEVELYLAAHEEEAERIRDLRAQNEWFHDRYDRYLAYPLPPATEALTRRLAEKLQRKRVRRTRMHLVFASVALVFVGAGAWAAVDQVYGAPGGNALFTLFLPGEPAAAPSGLESAPDGTVQVAALPSDGAGTASSEGGERYVPPDLREFGFELVGTRILDAAPNMNSAQLAYESEDGARVLLYFWSTAESGKRQLSLNQEGPVSVLFWTDGGRGYSMIGEVDRERLLAMGQAVSGEWIAASGADPAVGGAERNGATVAPRLVPVAPEAAPRKIEAERPGAAPAGLRNTATQDGST